MVRRLVREAAPSVVVLATDLADESGWLTCAKLTEEFPEVRVILVGPAPTLREYEFADFVGASALLKQRNSTAALLHELEELALAAR